jgi:hypothetical protein
MRPLGSSPPRHLDARDPSRLVLAAGLVVTLALLVVHGCRSVAIPPAEEAPAVEGTLAGTVRGPEGVAPPPGRAVEAVEVDTGARYVTETGATGGFSLMVPPGRYRIEVTLVPGEEVVEGPEVVTIEAGELADDQDVVLGGAGVVRPD